MRFNFALDWMFLADPVDLRDRLLHTLYYSHGFPPGMNVIAGLALKLGQPAAINAVHALFVGFGLILVNSMFYLGRAVGLSARCVVRAGGGVRRDAGDAVLRAPVPVRVPDRRRCCVWSAALFHHAVRTQSFRAWLGCFAVCAVIGWIRSMFHLVWLVALIGLAVWASPAGARRRVLGAASGPTAALLALYLKNLLRVRGVRGADLRAVHLHHRHRPQPAGPGAPGLGGRGQDLTVRHEVAPTPARASSCRSSRTGPRIRSGRPMMNQLDRPSLGVPNFNHWFFLEINPRRMADARTYVAERPGEYADTVVLNVPEYLSAITAWHPFDKDERSPHWKHRQVLGGYERAVQRADARVPGAGGGAAAAAAGASAGRCCACDRSGGRAVWSTDPGRC